MNDVTLIQSLLRYSDRMNRMLFTAAGRLSDDKLSQPIDIGLGSLGRILLHVYNGELVWLARWRGEIETKWPSEATLVSPTALLAKLEALWIDRDRFVQSLSADSLAAVQTYRDSRGSLFRATLGDMILQGIIHSTHHRAQIVNAIKRLGGDALEVDYMVSVRQNYEPQA